MLADTSRRFDCNLHVPDSGAESGSHRSSNDSRLTVYASLRAAPFTKMIIVKNTERSCVKQAYDGLIHKCYRGHHARQRLENEVRVLEHLRMNNCPFVPRLVAVDRANLAIVQSNCGVSVQNLVDWRMKQLFVSLLEYHVEHGDCELRNVTYRATDGIFCIVDFELATVLEPNWSRQLQHLHTEIANTL